VNSEVIFLRCRCLIRTPLTYFLRRDDSDFAVFRFAKPEDAQAFAKRFGGERLACGTVTPKTSGPPERVVQGERKVQSARGAALARPSS
jgi:hypothetical protein